MRLQYEILKNRNVDELEEVIVFGVGYYGIMALQFMRCMDIRILACIDNNPEMKGCTLPGGIICSTPKFVKDVPVIIAVENKDAVSAITGQCEKLGYHDFIYPDFEKMQKEFMNIPDKEFLETRFFEVHRRVINWDNPITYNEKLQWLMLYDRNPQYSKMVDKYEVKRYVAENIGEKYIIPTLGVWKRFDEIDFDTLPNQFVLKCTHDCGSIVICKDKKKFDIEAARDKLEKALLCNFYNLTREWVYKDVEPRIIAEAYMEDAEAKELRDYKFFMFNGEAKALFVAQDRTDETEETKFDFFDMDFNHLNFINGHPNAKKVPEKPKMFDEMQTLAEKLSESIPHVRVDFYEVNGAVYFGELTFYHWGGLVPFEPEIWDEIFGSWIQLPTI